MFFTKKERGRLVISIAAASAVILLAGVSVAEEHIDDFLVTAASESGTEPAPPLPAAQLTTPDRIGGEYVKGYISDTGRMLTAPTGWSGSDWLKAGLVVGTTAGLYFADADIRSFSQRNRSSIGDKGAAFGSFIGNPLYALPPLGLFYLYGHFHDEPKARRASLLAAESLLLSGAFTMAVKVATGRPRPDTGETRTTWNGPGLNFSEPSFPSNHTTAAFSLAAVFAGEYGSNPLVPPIAYGLATLTGFARVYDDKHWASDAFFGGAIGYFVGKAVVSYHTGRTDTSLKILPTATRQGFGLMAEYRF